MAFAEMPSWQQLIEGHVSTIRHGGSRVDYSLTDRGQELVGLLLPVVMWLTEHANEALAERS